jgi:hypothetical protein
MTNKKPTPLPEINLHLPSLYWLNYPTNPRKNKERSVTWHNTSPVSRISINFVISYTAVCKFIFISFQNYVCSKYKIPKQFNLLYWCYISCWAYYKASNNKSKNTFTSIKELSKYETRTFWLTETWTWTEWEFCYLYQYSVKASFQWYCLLVIHKLRLGFKQKYKVVQIWPGLICV